MAVDAQKVEMAAGKVFGELGVAVTGPLIVLGDRLGLWVALAGAGPTTPADLASRTGLNERYLREWLRAVCVAGYLDYNPAAEAFTLTDEMAAVLATDSSPTSLIGVSRGSRRCGRTCRASRPSSGPGTAWGGASTTRRWPDRRSASPGRCTRPVWPRPGCRRSTTVH